MDDRVGSGILLVDKPRGMTSHDVVARLRSVLRVKKVGHAGTLDPDATGLLVVCVGSATKVSSLISEGDKRYFVRFRLGIETDTCDSTGTVTAERPANVSLEDIERVLPRFLGPALQLPPMFSAVKTGGRKLYEYAREGRSVEVAERKVVIHELHLTSFESPEGEIEVRCSRGTYVRALLRDIGSLLSTGAVTTAIRRTACGALTLDMAVALDGIVSAADPLREASRRLRPVAEVLSERPCLRVRSDAALGRVRNGAALRPVDMPSCSWSATPSSAADAVLIVDESGQAMALGALCGGGVRISRVL